MSTPPLLMRWAPFVLLVVSIGLGWATTPVLLKPDRMALSLAPSVALLIVRATGELLHRRFRVTGPVSVAGYAVHIALLTCAVALNPFLCIYGFFGYLDADRFLGERLAIPGVVVTGLICGFGQTGGLPGVTALPLLFVVLAGVNITLALSMHNASQSREREVAARERAAEQLAQAHAENLALHQQLLERAHEKGTAEERARLARELHDTVAQGLVGVIRQLETLPRQLEPEIRSRVELAERAARDCLTEARRAVRALGPHQLEEADLIDAVRAVAENWSLTHDIDISVRVDGIPAAGGSDEVVLRVVQEALANVARHSHAATATLTLSWLEDQLIVDLFDDGAGFDQATVVRGHGLAGMAERLSAVGGRLVVESAPGEGTTISAVVPR